MGEFRRFILSVIGTLEILFVIVITLIGGVTGGAIPSLLFGSDAGIIGFLIGAIAAFCLAGILVNISMSLGEIAKNTRRTTDLSEDAADETLSAGDLNFSYGTDQMSPEGGSASLPPHENTDLTDQEKEEARRLLDQLESKGFRIRDK
jgi:hypothetical protein